MLLESFEKKETYNVGIIGALNTIDQDFLNLLDERKFPINHLKVLVPEENPEESISYRGLPAVTEELKEESFSDLDIAFFLTDSKMSSKYVPHAIQQGVLCFDSSMAFRQEVGVPLLVPEVNSEVLHEAETNRLVSLPSPAAVGLSLILNTFHDTFKLKEAHAVCLYPASHKGDAGVRELSSQSIQLLNGDLNIDAKAFPRQTGFSCFPQVGEFTSKSGSTEEEEGLERELHKILEDHSVQIKATCIQIPVFNGMSCHLLVETEKEIDDFTLQRNLKDSEFLEIERPLAEEYPTSFSIGSSEKIAIGRIQRVFERPNLFQLWAVWDNIHLGFALNAIKAAETLLAKI